MKVSKSVLISPISNEAVNTYLYLQAHKSEDNQKFSLKQIRIDLGFKVKDIRIERRNRDCLYHHLKELQFHQVLKFSYYEDELTVRFLPKEDEVEVPVRPFLDKSLLPTEKRMLINLFLIDISKNKKELFQSCKVQFRAGQRAIKGLIEKEAIRFASPMNLTKHFRYLWNDKEDLTKHLDEFIK